MRASAGFGAGVFVATVALLASPLLADSAFEWIRLDLNDDFHTEGPNTTSLLLEWSRPLSREFTERAEVEALIDQFVTVRNRR